jgi:hypothetical protein
MPGFMQGIHAFLCSQDVDGRDKPGHDGGDDVQYTIMPSAAVEAR